MPSPITYPSWLHDDELLRLVHPEVLEPVDAEVGEQPDHVRALDLEVGHVVRLVEEGARLHPGDLLVPPVRELGRHRGVDVRPDLRVARHLHRAAGRLQLLFQALVTHVLATSFVDARRSRGARRVSAK